MAQEALGMYLEYLIENGKSIKEPSLPQALPVIDNDFMAMISADIFVYKDKPNNKPSLRVYIISVKYLILQ
mgnify:FL=1